MNQQDAKIARELLARVLASAGFLRAINMQRLLTYLVEAHLSGRETAMSAAEIGREALGRSPKFDPAQDPVVRVECTRLRRLLDIYYQGEGRNDPLRFILPRGSYRIVIVPCGPVASDPAEPEGPHAIASQPDDANPAVAPAITPAQGRDRTQFGRVRRLYGAIAMMLFVIVLVGSVTLVPTFDRSSHLSRRAGPSTATIVPRAPMSDAGMLPRVRVQPFRHAADDALLAQTASHVEVALRDALARFDLIEVLANPADGVIDAQASEAPAVAAMPAIRPRDAADYVITTDLSRGRGSEIMFSGRVVNARTGVVLSVNEYIETTGGVDGEVQRETRQTLLRRAVSRIASPFGIIYSNELRARAASDPLVDTYACYLLAYETWKSPTPQREARTISCLEDALADQPDDYRALSLLAYTEVTLVREQRSYGAVAADLQRAAERARKALEIAPFSALSHHALFGVNKLAEDQGFARMIASSLLAMNPYDAHTLADVGAFNVLKGDFERGYTQLQEAYGHLPQPPEWYWGPIGLVALSRDDVPGLITAGNRVTTTGYALGVIVKLLSLHLAGDVTRITAWQSQLRSVLPQLDSEPEESLRRIGLTEPARRLLIPQLRKFGLT